MKNIPKTTNKIKTSALIHVGVESARGRIVIDHNNPPIDPPRQPLDLKEASISLLLFIEYM